MAPDMFSNTQSLTWQANSCDPHFQQLQANAVHFVRIAGNPADRCAHLCGLDHTAVVLAAVIVAMFIAFQLAWTFAILSARAHLASLTVPKEELHSAPPVEQLLVLT